MTPSIGAVVVHHRRFPHVLGTVQCLLDAGVPAHSLVVVDNSEEDRISDALAEAADGWRVHGVPNRGYGAAANAGVGLLTDCDVVLVVTHEVVIDASSVAALVGAVTEEADVGAAGPALIRTDDSRVWSRGGRLTRVLRLPQQIVTAGTGSPAVRDVDWLDGCCVAYRPNALVDNPFREDFFLYFEETDLHARLRAQGLRVVVVEGASASQSTAGMPSYWGCRNVVLFQRAHGSTWSRLVAPPYFTARRMAIAGLSAEWSEVLAAPRGLLAGYTYPRTRRRWRRS